MNYISLLCILFLSIFFFPGFSLFQNRLPLPPTFTKNHSVLSAKDHKKVTEQLNMIAELYSSEAVQWWVSYKEALIFKKTDLKLFCNHMNFLSKIEQFPLKKYAQLNYYSECHSDVKLTLSDFPPWMKKSVTLIKNKKAKKFKSKPDIIETSYILYKISSSKYQKETYLLQAIKIARKNKDPRIKKWREELYQLSPRYLPKPSHKQTLSVANDFRYVRQMKKASIYYRQILNRKNTSFDEKNQAFKWMRWIYKDKNNRKKYLIATTQWKRWLKRQMKTQEKALKLYYDTSLLLARTQWTLRKPYKALKILTELKKELEGKTSLFQIYRLKGFIFEDLHDLKKSIIFFEKALSQKTSDFEMKEYTQWQYAWVLKKLGLIEKSISILNSILENTKNDYFRSRVLFWLASLSNTEGNTKKASEIYEYLIENDPLSYYGMLAHYKKKKKIKIDNDNSHKHNKRIAQNKNYTIAHWLLSLDQHTQALDFLEYHLNKYKKRKGMTVKEWEPLFYYMSLAHSYLPLFQLVGKLPLKKRTLFFQSYAHMLFPLRYKKEIDKTSHFFNIESEIIHALIRQESAYNPKARSPSDAFGLMQIRPFVAKKIAKETGIKYSGINDLYTPKKNILLGTAFLRKQFKRYDSQFIITMATYNAGGVAVKHWLKQISTEDSLAFIEEIPYEETRTYVRLLIRNFIFYKLLSHPKKEIAFPEWVLHIKNFENEKNTTKGKTLPEQTPKPKNTTKGKTLPEQTPKPKNTTKGKTLPEQTPKPKNTAKGKTLPEQTPKPKTSEKKSAS